MYSSSIALTTFGEKYSEVIETKTSLKKGDGISKSLLNIYINYLPLI